MIISISGKKQSGKDLVGKAIQYLIGHKESSIIDIIPKIAGAMKDDKRYFHGSEFEIKKFADSLKEIICILIGCTREQLEDEKFKNTELGEDWRIWKFVLDEDANMFDGMCQLTNVIFSSREDAESYINEHKIINVLDIVSEVLTPRNLLQTIGTEAGRNIVHPNLWILSLLSKYIGDIEEWVKIKGFEKSYEISSFGNIRSLDRKIVYGDENKGEYNCIKGKILKPTISSNGYQTVKLSGKTFTIQKLVADNFLQKSPNENFVINHIDGNKTNNFYKNLEWISNTDNISHSHEIGIANVGIKQKDSKLSEDDVIEIKHLLELNNISQSQIAKKFKISKTTISEIKTNKKWKHVGKEKNIITPIIPIIHPKWIITDVRFMNEVEAIQKRKGLIIRINRDTSKIYPLEWNEYKQSLKPSTDFIEKYPTDNGFIKWLNTVEDEKLNKLGKLLTHDSEILLDDFEGFDYVIDNNGTIEELIEQIKLILIEEKII